MLFYKIFQNEHLKTNDQTKPQRKGLVLNDLVLLWVLNQKEDNHYHQKNSSLNLFRNLKEIGGVGGGWCWTDISRSGKKPNYSTARS